MNHILQNRIKKIQKCLPHYNIDTLMVSIQENRFYLSGFSARDLQFNESAGTLFITEDQLVLATNMLYALEAKEQAPLYEIYVFEQGLPKAMPEILTKLKTKVLGIEGIRISHKQYIEMVQSIENAKLDISIQPVEDLVEHLRVIKSEDEILRTQKAIDVTERVFLKCMGMIRAGMSEKSIAWMIERMLREEGASQLSFPVIMASGPNSALPHATPSDRLIQKGEPLLFDFGIILDNYCSDITRTVVIGEPNDQFIHMITTVNEALEMATRGIKKGESSKKIDSIAREHINAKGYKGKFTHNLGHGTGLAVHELPSLGRLKEMTLDKGMIVTVEPGIYIEGWGGIRLENQIVVEEDGARILNRLDPLDYRLEG